MNKNNVSMKDENIVNSVGVVNDIATMNSAKV